jgi:hypothetical protein
MMESSYSFGTFAEMLGRLPNLSGFKIADLYLLWPVPKLKIDTVVKQIW